MEPQQVVIRVTVDSDSFRLQKIQAAAQFDQNLANALQNYLGGDFLDLGGTYGTALYCWAQHVLDRQAKVLAST